MKLWQRVSAPFLLAAGTSACGLILGIPDAVRDDTVGQEGGKPDTGTDGTAGDGGQDSGGQDTGMVDTGTDGGKNQPVALTMNNRPWGLAIDDMYLYWSEPSNNLIGRINKDGSGMVSLATGINQAYGVHQLATDGADVYWAETTTIFRCARGGCSNSPTKIQPNLPNSAYVVAVDANNVYWEQDAQLTIYKCAKGGGSISPVNSAPLSDAVEDMVVDSGFVVATLNDGSVVKVPTAGGSVIVLAAPSTASALGLSIYNGKAYYTFFDDPGMIEYTPLSGPQGMTPVALMQRLPYGITNDGLDLWWTETVTLGPSGNVKKCSLANCTTPTTMADMQNVPKWIVTDQTAVYWTNFGNGNNEGGLMKLVK